MRIGRLALLITAGIPVAGQAADFTLPQALAYPFVDDLTADKAGQRIAWVRIVGGVRNIWVAEAPGFAPRQVTQFAEDDGQELTQPTWAPDGKTLVFVRGGDHDGNWPAPGGLQPNPTSGPEEPKITIWRAGLAAGSKAAKVTEGDAPALSTKGELAYLKDGQVWEAKLAVTGDGKDAHRLFFDRGKDASLRWSPDGSKLLFVSKRGDHSFIGVFRGGKGPILWVAPSSSLDGDPVWSPDGSRIAFTRQPGQGGAPEPLLENVPQPWAIWTADAATGAATRVWASGKGLRDSYPDVHGDANLYWAAGDRLTFLSTADNWQHLYSVPAKGGAPTLLTPGEFMVEHMALSPDGTSLVYSANTGATKDDEDRRHLYHVAAAGGAPVALTSGESLEWAPAALASGTAFIAATAQQPPAVVIADGKRRTLAGQEAAAGFAGAQFVTPRYVSWKAPDGLTIHGQLFAAPGAAPKPGVIFVHGGPPRQMMLGWSYMRYYSNAYAMNQYLAAHGFAVLSVNYRLGIGYGLMISSTRRTAARPGRQSIRTCWPAGAGWRRNQESMASASASGADRTADC